MYSLNYKNKKKGTLLGAPFCHTSPKEVAVLTIVSKVRILQGCSLKALQKCEVFFIP